ncbi:MAG: hypothetical protein ACFBSG_02045 [Leptolyngbyaceae cyanobacterium]
MLFDRILEDSLGFIRRKLWSAKTSESSAQHPFHPSKSVDGDFGIIHLLEPRDTPRAVRTWIFTPKRKDLNSTNMVATSTPMDLHIYTDFLGPLPSNTTPSALEQHQLAENQRQQGISIPTHRIQILKASHFLNADGFYTLEVLHWQDIDCYPPQGSQLSGSASDIIATHFTDGLAFECLKIPKPLQAKPDEWGQVIEEILGETKAKFLPKSL